MEDPNRVQNDVNKRRLEQHSDLLIAVGIEIEFPDISSVMQTIVAVPRAAAWKIAKTLSLYRERIPYYLQSYISYI